MFEYNGCDSGILTSSPVVHRLCRCRCRCIQGRSCPLRHLLARGCHKPAKAPNPNNKFSSSLNSTPSVSLDSMNSFRHGKFTCLCSLVSCADHRRAFDIRSCLDAQPRWLCQGFDEELEKGENWLENWLADAVGYVSCREVSGAALSSPSSATPFCSSLHCTIS
jgi:hypothetical protein